MNNRPPPAEFSHVCLKQKRALCAARALCPYLPHTPAKSTSIAGSVVGTGNGRAVVGRSVGESVIFGNGEMLGEAVVGVCVGAGVGSSVYVGLAEMVGGGLGVGADVGRITGWNVGSGVGVCVGDGVGIAIGLSVG